MAASKDWAIDEFVSGSNRLPEGYFWNVVAGTDGAVVEVSLASLFGTRVDDPRHPDAPIVRIPTDWSELVRLAVQISHMAQAVGVRLPDGVLVKTTH